MLFESSTYSVPLTWVPDAPVGVTGTGIVAVWPGARAARARADDDRGEAGRRVGALQPQVAGRRLDRRVECTRRGRHRRLDGLARSPGGAERSRHRRNDAPLTGGDRI